MKTLQKTTKSLFLGVLTTVLVVFGTFGSAVTALASTPSLGVSSTGNNQVQITVTNADPNSTINLYYNQSSSGGVYVANIGVTNSSGYFSTTLNQNSYSIPQNSYVYVIVNGQTSQSVAWTYNNNNNTYGNITLSQNSVTIGFNQSITVNVYGGNGTYYISNSSNSGIASANISGSTVNVYGYNTTGNSTFTVCSYNNSGCATLYVSVQANYNNNQPTYFSQSTVNLSVGQGQAITVYGSGSYNISSNSNPTAISALVSGNILNVYGSAPGSGTLNICSTSGSGGCSSLYVVVAGGYYNNYNYNGSNNYYNGYNNGYTGYNYNNGYNNGYNYNNTGYSYNNGYNYNTTYYPQNGSVLGASTDVPSQVYLSQVPATGVSATNLKTILFTLGLIIWSLFATYIFMAKQKRKALGR